MSGRQSKISKHLECPVCMDIFRDPHMLPCAHTICKGCLESLIRDSSIECPVCRAKHAIPPNKADGFLRNLVVAGLIDTLCGECRSKEPEVECSHCNKSLCVDCQTNHMTFEGGKHSLKELGLTLQKGKVALNDTEDDQLGLVVEKEIKKVEEFIVQKVHQRTEMLITKMKSVIQSNRDSLKPWKDNVKKCMEETQSYLDTMSRAIGKVFGDHVTEKLISDIKTQSCEKIRKLELAISKAPPLSKPFIKYNSAEVISVIMSFGSIDLHPPGSNDCPVAVDGTCTTQPDKPRVVGKQGSGPGEFNNPCDGDGQALLRPVDICINSNRDIIISDLALNRILVYDKTGSYKRDIPVPWDSPWGIVVEDDGFLYLSDWGIGSVMVIDNHYKIISTIRGRIK